MYKRQVYIQLRGMNLSKCSLAFWILSVVAAVWTPGCEMITMMYVLAVKASMKAQNRELRTSIPWNCDCALPQESLNCFTMLDIFSKRWASKL